MVRGVGVLTVVAFASLASAEPIRGQSACGPVSLETRGTAERGTFDGELCAGTIKVEGSYERSSFRATRVRLEGLGQPVELRRIDLPPFDPRMVEELDRFTSSFETLKTARTLLQQASPSGEASGSFSVGIGQLAQIALGGGDVGCTDLDSVLSGAMVDIEDSIRGATYYVPPACLVIAEGPVEVDDLRVDGMLLRIGGPITAKSLRTGTAPVGPFGGYVVAFGVDASRTAGGRAAGAVFGDRAPGPGVITTEQVSLEGGGVLAEGLVADETSVRKGSVTLLGGLRSPRVRLQEGASLRATELRVDLLDVSNSSVSASGPYTSTRGDLSGGELRLRGGSVRAGATRLELVTLHDGGLEVTGPLTASRLTGRSARAEVQSATVETLSLEGGGFEASGTLVANLLESRSGGVQAGDAEIETVRLTEHAALTARSYAGPRRERATLQGTVRLTDSNLTGGDVRFATIDALRANVTAHQSFDIQRLSGDQTHVQAGRFLRARTGEGRVTLTGGSLRVEGSAVTGTPGFDGCRAHEPQVDVGLLDTRETPIEATHVRLDEAKLRGGHLLPANPETVASCIEIAKRTDIDGSPREAFVIAPRIYASLGNAVVSRNTWLEVTESGGGPSTGNQDFGTEQKRHGSGASFGGFGGTTADLNENLFDPAEQPGSRPELGKTDSPLDFRETGIGGWGSRGGKGGGVIRVRAEQLVFDGTARASGGKASRGSGGGSGGTVFVEVTGALSGTGLWQVNGGNGGYGENHGDPFRSAGGGSAGRIRFDCGSRNGWKGRTETYGGLGSELNPETDPIDRIPAWDDWRNHGGPGTVYWAIGDGPDELVIEGPLDEGKHRGVGILNGEFPDAIVRIRRAIVVSDGLKAAGLRLEDRAALVPNNPRVRLDFPPRQQFFPFKPRTARPGGAVVQVVYPSPVWNDDFNEKLRIELSGDLFIDATSRLDVSKLGGAYRSESLPHGSNRAGGSHGGFGGMGRAGNPNTLGRPIDPHGSALEPTEVGSGGFGEYQPNAEHRPHMVITNGGVGGGALRVVAGGTARVDGEVRADGDAGINLFQGYHEQGAGGGAGGSIWLSARTLEGKGRISASGGAGSEHAYYGYYGGGGGGGRVRLDLERRSGWKGRVDALGGSGAELTAARAKQINAEKMGGRTDHAAWKDLRNDGGPGTILWNVQGEPPTLRIEGAKGMGGWAVIEGDFPEHHVVLQSARASTSGLKVRALRLTQGSVLTAKDQRAWLHPRAYGLDRWLPVRLWSNPEARPLEISAADALEVDTSSRIDLTGLGEYSRYEDACSRGAYPNRAGGSHAGKGGTGRDGRPSDLGCPTEAVATELGAGGFGREAVSGARQLLPCTAGGFGGGAVKLTVGGAARIDGWLLADGSSGGEGKYCTDPDSSGAGGGAGGTVELVVGELLGRGVISASGGAGTSDLLPPSKAWGGGGGGGRIELTVDRCLFAGKLMVEGGAGGAGEGVSPALFKGAPGSAQAGACQRK